MVRGRWGKLAVLVLSAAAAVLALAPAASAEGEPDTGALNAFGLKSSNGYRVTVLATSGKQYRKGRVLIVVRRKGQEVSYFAPAKVTDSSVEAHLGALGGIDVDFQPSGEMGVAHPVCDRSQRTTYAKGSYVGTIELRGEEGYTQVRADGAPYSLHPLVDFICPGPSEGRGGAFPGAALLVRGRAGAERIGLQVNQNRPGARVHVSASTSERRGRIAISRESTANYPAAAFHFDPKLRQAVLSLPEPFAGTGHFRREAKPANRWTGNLTADFPGRSKVSLTGSGFDANLVHASYEGKSARAVLSRPSLSLWPSTKPSPTAFATPSLLAPR